MDLADLMTGREYYVGTKFVFKPSFGLRGAFIRQKLIDSFAGLPGAGGSGGLHSQTDAPAFGGDTTLSIDGISQFWNRSWAVGPKMGLDISWKLGSGFRAIGNGSADILYTRYNGLKNNSFVHFTFTDGMADYYTVTTLRTKQKNLGLLRTHLDLELGFGWGMYFYENQKHFDIAATYNFQVFFNQNMFRQFTDGNPYGNSILPNGDLFVQGLNVACRFDF